MAEIQVAVFTDAGTRDHNEDACGYGAQDGRACFVVADGLGGQDKGEVASHAAVDYIMEHFQEMECCSEESLLALLEGADQAVRERQEECPDMRTTVAAAFVENGRFWYFHAGDTRCYYLKNGCIYTRSKDHSIPQVEVSMGEIRTEDIRFHEDRNKLLKVLGDAEKIRIGRLDEPVEIEPGDAFLLCSDGFWEYVYETEMEIDLVKSRTAKEWMEYMVKRLLLRPAVERDNYSVLVCWL